jgi:hypothetical protein
MCGLLTALPHFNYRTDLLSALVPKASDLEPSVHGAACEALASLFTDDRRGEATLEAAQMVAQAVKDAECQARNPTCPSHVFYAAVSVQLPLLTQLRSQARDGDWRRTV